MRPAEIITKKRDGHVLTNEEIAKFVIGFTAGSIPDYQMSALAMAIFFRGMDRSEVTSLTQQMLASGESLSWNDGPPVVDKHSTGGIGDKVSLVLVPMLACCGLRVPMISGRGLGITGGTLDKLESIPGFRTELAVNEIQHQVESIGCVITGTTPTIVPADRKLYALRDVTATVASIPLITSSIMSKKLAESLDALVLDVKCGNGAFMKTQEDAHALAQLMIHIGEQMGVKTSAVISDMNQPLGTMVGNALEVIESIEALQGSGSTDLMDLTFRLGCELLLSSNVCPDRTSAEQKLAETIESGRAFERFEQMVHMQEGSLSKRLALERKQPVLANDGGFIASIDGQRISGVLIEMRGGRRIQTDHINPAVGIELLHTVGDPVHRGDAIAQVYFNDESQTILNEVSASIRISESPPQSRRCPPSV